MSGKPVVTVGYTKIDEAIQGLIANFLERLKPAMERLGEAFKNLHEAYWRAYREAGAPYGETEEGLWRWAGERAEAERLARRAAEILSDHRALANMRNRFIKN